MDSDPSQLETGEQWHPESGSSSRLRRQFWSWEWSAKSKAPAPRARQQFPLFTEPQELVERDLGVSCLQDLQRAMPRRELGDGAFRSGFKGCRMQGLILECYIRIFLKACQESGQD